MDWLPILFFTCGTFRWAISSTFVSNGFVHHFLLFFRSHWDVMRINSKWSLNNSFGIIWLTQEKKNKNDYSSQDIFDDYLCLWPIVFDVIVVDWHDSLLSNRRVILCSSLFVILDRWWYFDARTMTCEQLQARYFHFYFQMHSSLFFVCSCSKRITDWIIAGGNCFCFSKRKKEFSKTDQNEGEREKKILLSFGCTGNQTSWYNQQHAENPKERKICAQRFIDTNACFRHEQTTTQKSTDLHSR